MARLPASAVELPPDAGRAGAYVRLRVTDNGAGITDERAAAPVRAVLHDQGQGKGTGLGLASVHGIVHQSRGWIDVDQRAGRRRGFAMHFPAIGFRTAVEPGPPRQSSRRAGDETVLLVEDEEAVRTIIAAVLRRQG